MSVKTTRTYTYGVELDGHVEQCVGIRHMVTVADQTGGQMMHATLTLTRGEWEPFVPDTPTAAEPGTAVPDREPPSDGGAA